MLTCKQKKAFEGYEAGQTEKVIKQHFRNRLLHCHMTSVHVSFACGAFHLKPTPQIITGPRHFITHPRKSTHALTQKVVFYVFVSRHCTPTSKYQPLTREGCEPTVERPVGSNRATLFI